MALRILNSFRKNALGKNFGKILRQAFRDLIGWVLRGLFVFRKANASDNTLLEDDDFAVFAQCYHNLYREAAGLEPVKWNPELATFAANWSKSLETKGCALEHSTLEMRTAIGGKFISLYFVKKSEI